MLIGLVLEHPEEDIIPCLQVINHACHVGAISNPYHNMNKGLPKPGGTHFITILINSLHANAVIDRAQQHQQFPDQLPCNSHSWRLKFRFVRHRLCDVHTHHVPHNYSLYTTKFNRGHLENPNKAHNSNTIFQTLHM